jgi:hypothetical protein
MYEFSSVPNEPYARVVPYSTWPVAGALTDHVIVAPVWVMAEAPTALITSGVPGGVGVGVGVGVDLGVGVGVDHDLGGARRVWRLRLLDEDPEVAVLRAGVIDTAVVAAYGTASAASRMTNMPVANQAPARPRCGESHVAGACSAIQRFPSQNIRRSVRQPG